MPVITPQTDLILLKCPLEVDQQNQLTFANATGQYNYFYSLPKLAVSNFTYQREDSTVRFPAQVDTIRSYNYCMYRNTAYSNKWFYAFITGIRYVNDKMTELKLKTDVWQTWQFDITLKSSYVEREHVANDTIGAHTLDENVGTGEYMINAVTEKVLCAPDSTKAYIVLAATEPPQYIDGTPFISSYVSRMYNGIISGAYLFLFEYSAAGSAALGEFINWYDSKNKANAIISVYAAPKTAYPSGSVSTTTLNTGSGTGSPFSMPVTYSVLVMTTDVTDMGNTTISINNTLNGYTPKNNRLYCYPFNYVMVSNNRGTDNIYHYEDFSTPSSISFKCVGALVEGSSVKCYPVNYKKNTTAGSGYAFGTDMQPTPTFSWNNDMYLNWQAQNSWQGMGNAGARTVSAAVDMPTDTKDAGGFFSYLGDILEKGASYVGATVNAVKNTISGASYQASLQPDQVSGQSTGDVNFASSKCGFTFYQMSVRAEVAAMIDNYLSMYGYKVNTMKAINITSRRYWNYIKCIQANITGDIPQDDLQEIKKLFNDGITFWHDTTKYLDYSQTNAIVS